MTPGDDSAGRPPLERFAAEWLGLKQEGRADLLRRIAEEDYHPALMVHEAARAVGGRPVPRSTWLAEEAARAEAARLGDEVERFAAGFFAIPPAERREQWRRLGARCKGHPSLAEHLRHLGHGLDVDRGALRGESPLVERLAGHVLELFVLRPRPRAAACRQRVREIRGDSAVTNAELSRALNRLASRHPVVAALVPQFLARLALPRKPKRLRTSASFAGLWTGSTQQKGLTAIGVAGACLLIRAIVAISTQVPAAGPSAQGSFFVTSPPGLSRLPLPPAVPKQALSPTFLRYFRDQFKEPIRSELARLGRSIGEPELQRVVDALPTEGAEIGGPAMLRLAGFWTDPVRGRYSAALRKALAEQGITLDDAEFDQVAERCFPRSGNAARRKPPPRPRGDEGAAP
jgi:hypothetical protein